MSRNIGPHLLGRVPSPTDDRDFQMRDYLASYDQATGVLTPDTTLQEVHDSFGLTTWHGIYAFWKAFKALFAGDAPTPVAPTPTPGPPGGVWPDEQQLDQGDTGHCVGFGWCQWGNTLPVEDQFKNPDGDAVYYECKILDGEKDQENGSTVRSGAKAMKNRARIGVYAFAASTADITAWLAQHGPVVVGTDWHEAMFNPDSDGWITPTGSIAGGHCYVILGHLEADGAYVLQNSWGQSWGENGRAKIKVGDFQKLLDADGEACSALELPL